MSTLMIRDLDHSTQLDHKAMSAVRGGFADVNVNVNQATNISQQIIQLQEIAVLNNSFNNSVIGAPFSPFRLNISPTQRASTAVAV